MPERESPRSLNLATRPSSSTEDSPRTEQPQERGWAHIGDPDSANGYIIRRLPRSQLWALEDVSRHHSIGGQRFEYLHTLVRVELYNNSFVAISPTSANG